jgi:hypothetical protein
MIPGQTYRFVDVYYSGTGKPAVNLTTHWLSSTGYEGCVKVTVGVWGSYSGVPGYFWRTPFEFRKISSSSWPSVPVTVVMEFGMSGEAVGRVNILLEP